ncbi:MAG: energy-coupling factor transporter ATPase [Mycoplasma sp.]|nr:energy-coupling factor transporter ATPase [Mycoplasma sp.]
MIKIENLLFKYFGSDDYALKDVNIEIPKGKYIAIIGHNGSGKSTLSKLLVGLYKAESGKISINDIEITKETIKEIRSLIGIVYQNPDNQFIGSTVEDDIAFGLENKKISREEMRKIIYDLSEKVGMKEFLNKEPENLSGGQKQRVAIASTLALDPEIIIFDEVTSMLDPKGKDSVLKIIRKIQKDKNKTLISITHDMDEAIISDEVIVLSGGKIIASGDPKKILSDPKIIKLAKIDNPFIYKVSNELKKLNKKIKVTYDEKELLEQICK